MIIVVYLCLAFLLYDNYKLRKENKLYYNNYMQCLKALSEYDSGLKKYLEAQDE